MTRKKIGKRQINIVGHPGTGKTTTLAKKLVHLLERVEPDAVLCTSFSRSAAKGLIKKLREYGLDADALRHFRTVHSLAAHALDLNDPSKFVHPDDAYRFYDEMGIEYERTWSSIDDIELYGYLGSYYLSDALGNRLQAYFQFLKKVKVYDDAVRRAIRSRELFDRFRIDERYASAWVYEIYDAWEAEKRRLGRYEYEDMLVEALESEAFPTEARFGLIDEAQDLSPLQVRLLSLWLEGAEEVYMAFDVMQTIYFFNGSSPSLILSLENDEEQILDYSYRVPRVPWEYAKRIAFLNNIRSVKKVKPAEREGSVSFISEREIPGLINPSRSTFILFRTNNAALSFIAELFKEENILVRGMGHIATLAQDEYFKLQYNCVHKLCRDKLPSFEEIRSIITRIPAKYLRRGVKTLFVKRLDDARRRLEDMRMYKSFEETNDSSLFYSFFRSVGSVRELQEVLAEPRVFFGKGHRGEFIRKILTSITPSSPAFSMANAFAGTYHSAKGLEADDVILFDYIPPSRADMFEERCLTFVGLTRTKDRALIVPVEGSEGIIERDIMR